MEISVVIPAYDEEKRIVSTLEAIHSYLKERFEKFEIIVIDDGSSDLTAKFSSINNNIVLRNEKNMGKGYSVRRGILYAKYDTILFSDADLATPIHELGKMREILDLGYDIVIASRNMSNSDISVKQPLYRQVLGKIFPYVVNLLAIKGIKDTQCGFKLYTRLAAKKIAEKQRIDRFAFDVEQLFIAKKYKMKIKEVPVKWIDKAGSKVDTFKDSFRMLRDLIRIRYYSFKGYYDDISKKKNT
jgi:dolichyl-phosphate beta-glucosyltransferase